jgi:heptosyltransferase-2
MRDESAAVLVQHGAGDLLMALPLLRACDEHLGARGRLLLVVRSEQETGVLRQVPWRSRVEIVPLRAGPQAARLGVARLAASLPARRLDYLLAPHANDSAPMSLLALASLARVRVGPPGRWSRFGFNRVVPRVPGRHKVEHYLEFARAAGIAPLNREGDLRVPVSEAQQAEARALLPGWRADQEWIVLAPSTGSVEAHKRWPAAHFARLAELLLEASPRARVAVTGSPGERDVLERVAGAFAGPPGRLHVVTSPSLGLALAVTRQAACVVTACSGASHMAAAVDVPVVGIYGPTNPAYTGPYRNLATVRTDLACAPCYRTGFITGCAEPACMAGISPERVYPVVREVLLGVRFPPPAWADTTAATAAAPPRAAPLPVLPRAGLPRGG